MLLHGIQVKQRSCMQLLLKLQIEITLNQFKTLRMVTKGSFPQLLLTPINFDAEFEANMQRAQAAAVDGQA